MYIRTLNVALVFLLVVCVGSSLPAWGQSTSTGTVAGSVTVGNAAVALFGGPPGFGALNNGSSAGGTLRALIGNSDALVV